MVDFLAASKPKKRAAPVPTKLGVLDLSAAREKFAWVRAELDKRVALADALEITDEASLKLSVEMSGDFKRLEKQIDATRKETIKDPDTFVRTVNTFCRDFTSQISIGDDRLKRKRNDYLHRIELARREAERKAQEEAKKLQEDLDKEAAEKGVAPIEVPAPVMPKTDPVVRTDTGAAMHVRRVWRAEVVDTKLALQSTLNGLIPEHAVSWSQSALNELAKAGLREIPGLRIFEDIITPIRT